VLACLLTDHAFDVQDFERIEGQMTVMALRVGKTGDGVEDSLVDAFAGTDRHDDVLMLVMFGHESLLQRVPSPNRAGGALAC
jgi:hypothetical protein